MGSAPSPTPQFGKAEYIGEPGSDRCATCSQPIVGTYYRVSGAMTCATCAAQSHTLQVNDSHAAFVRGILFGIGGAILGLILYSAFGIITGLVIGYLSLAVGYIVGKAIMMGSRGVGGRRYQIAAVILTYAAVSMSAVPIAISMQSKQRAATRSTNTQSPELAQEQKQLESEAGQDTSKEPPAENRDSSDAPGKPRMGVAAAIGYLAMLGLASPFLDLQDPVHGFIGLVILLVGIRIAWRITSAAVPEVVGPFENSPTNSPAP
jgi:hypothetical protein